MLKHTLIAAGLVAGAGCSEAAVLLSPGDAAFLGTVQGSAVTAAVAYGGGSTFAVVVELLSSGTYGYFVDANGDEVVDGMGLNASPVHIGVSSAPVLGGTYYLATSDDLIVPGNPLTNADFISEDFTLIPEPATYALIGGLGLVSFAGYRRFRR